MSSCSLEKNSEDCQDDCVLALIESDLSQTRKAEIICDLINNKHCHKPKNELKRKILRHIVNEYDQKVLLKLNTVEAYINKNDALFIAVMFILEVDVREKMFSMRKYVRQEGETVIGNFVLKVESLEGSNYSVTIKNIKTKDELSFEVNDEHYITIITETVLEQVSNNHCEEIIPKVAPIFQIGEDILESYVDMYGFVPDNELNNLVSHYKNKRDCKPIVVTEYVDETVEVKDSLSNLSLKVYNTSGSYNTLSRVANSWSSSGSSALEISNQSLIPTLLLFLEQIVGMSPESGNMSVEYNGYVYSMVDISSGSNQCRIRYMVPEPGRTGMYMTLQNPFVGDVLISNFDKTEPDLLEVKTEIEDVRSKTTYNVEKSRILPLFLMLLSKKMVPTDEYTKVILPGDYHVEIYG